VVSKVRIESCRPSGSQESTSLCGGDRLRITEDVDLFPGVVLGAVIAGVGADASSPRTAILIVVALTGASGTLVAVTS
jgi:hypothetical protein